MRDQRGFSIDQDDINSSDLVPIKQQRNLQVYPQEENSIDNDTLQRSKQLLHRIPVLNKANSINKSFNASNKLNDEFRKPKQNFPDPFKNEYKPKTPILINHNPSKFNDDNNLDHELLEEYRTALNARKELSNLIMKLQKPNAQDNYNERQF